MSGGRSRPESPPSDLHAFCARLEREGELVQVGVAVDPVLEISAIAQRAVAQDKPALLFERVQGSDLPLLINSLASHKRIELALGRPVERLAADIERLLEKLPRLSPGALWSERSTLRRGLAARPRRVRSSRVHEVAAPLDLGRLPILQVWPQDGGRFITLPLVHTRDPQSGRSNLGIYRMQVFGSAKTGMHWQIQKGGGFHYYRAEQRREALPVAVALGADPILLLSGVLPLPEGLEEIAFAGFLRGRATPMVRGRTVALDYPASAEIVLEGLVPPGERRDEGPFGDHFGHYFHVVPYPVFHLKAIWRRRDAIYPAAVVGKPPQEDRYLGEAVSALLEPFVKLLHPELTALWTYYESGFHNVAAAAVAARYVKEPIKTALGLLGQSQLSLTKCVVMVDSDVDVRDFRAVLRAIGRHFRPERDFVLIPGTALDSLDYTSFKMHAGSKLILDATGLRNTVLPHGEPAAPPVDAARAFTEPTRLDPRVRAFRLWEETLLAVVVERDAPAVLEALLRSDRLGPAKIVAAVSPDVDLADDVALHWGIFTRFDPARDITFSRMEARGARVLCSGVMAIDATFKPGYPDPVTMPAEITRRVDARWAEYGLA
ncbi:MAG TPA: UbiD family decarboxylase [Limnochordia bacterium]|nr:UbiD family decarboxylase [Limnochordia bacterium]